MGTAPSGWQTPKTNWTTADPVGNGDLNRIEGNIEAIDLGNRTIDDAQVPSSDTGTLRQFLDWIANRLKAITGKTNWFDAPAETIEMMSMIAKFSSLSLTNYDSNAVPQIAAGSRVLVKDTPVYFSSNTTITGTPTANSINFITITTAGVPAWTDTAPVWKDAYQQYMDAGETLRYAGGCYYDGTNYKMKWVYTNQHAGPRTRIMNLSLVGSSRDWQTGAQPRGHDCEISDTTYQVYIPVNFETPYAVITKLEVWANGGVTWDGDAILSWADTGGDATGMASVNVSNVSPNGSDSSITEPVIDEARHYVIYLDANNLTGSMTFDCIQITYTEIVRC